MTVPAKTAAAVAAGDEQVDHEDGRCQLETRRQANCYSFAPGAVRKAEVVQHSDCEEQVDLAIAQSCPHWLEPDRSRSNGRCQPPGVSRAEPREHRRQPK